jgi:hypothetical protein
MQYMVAILFMGLCVACVVLVLFDEFEDNLLQRIGLSICGLCSFLAAAAHIRHLPIGEQLLGVGIGALLVAIGSFIKFVPQGDEHEAHQ